jgi:hypothetical protein
VPASVQNICRYIAFLSISFKYSSIKVYLNVVRLLHLQVGYGNPVSNHIIQQVLKGVRRTLSHEPYRRPIMTTVLLKQIRSSLNLASSVDTAVWAACLLAFYGMLRISSLFPPHPNMLVVRSARIFKWGIVVSFKYSKTVQYAERQPFVVLPWGKDQELCPVTAILASWRKSGVTKLDDPLLAIRVKDNIQPLTRPIFHRSLTDTLDRLGLVGHGYSGHSFRRGGATHALNSGIPAEVIQAQGDWRSLAYLDYIDTSSPLSRVSHIQAMV